MKKKLRGKSKMRSNMDFRENMWMKGSKKWFHFFARSLTQPNIEGKKYRIEVSRGYDIMY